ncbi:MAG: magnesium transporter CorA family protein [Ignavibacteriales bacterium]|nr:magnesium transporter CorA family protein [Ignavibacteriales bacterium]
MLTRYEIVQNALVETQSEEGPVLVYVNPDAAEREMLRTKFDIDDHTLSSALDPDEISRVEFSPDFISLIWKRPTNYSGKDNFYFNVASVGLFLIDQNLIVVLPDDIPLIESGGRHAPQLRNVYDVMLAFLYYTTRHYLEHLKVIKMVSRELQQRINTSMENKHLIQMFNLSESLIYYLNAINANGVALVKLNNYAQKSGYPRAAIELLDDIIIENNQCFKQAEIYSTVYSGLMDARGSLVNNNVNVLLRKLTMINVVFLPLNLIAGIGGMSEFSMMTHGVDWKISYSLFLAAMVLIGLLTGVVLGKINFGGAKRANPRKRWRFFS